MKTVFQRIHERALEVAGRLRKCEAELVQILQEVDEKRVYLELGYRTLSLYAIEALGLSEDQAWCFVSVSRKAKRMPEMREAIEGGRVTVSKLKPVLSIISPENCSELLELVQTLSKAKLEKKIAEMNPKSAVKEYMRYVNSEIVELHLGISVELSHQIRRAQDVLSQKKGTAVNLEEALKEVVGFFLYRNDPVEKAKRAEERIRRREKKDQARREEKKPAALVEGDNQDEFKGEANVKNENVWGEEGEPLVASDPETNASRLARASSAPGRKTSRPRRPAMLEQQVWLRDQGQCAHRDHYGHRCEESRWLDVHHIVPIVEGGDDCLENLQLLCRSHHRLFHYHHHRQSGEAHRRQS